MSESNLFSSYSLGDLDLTSRIVMAPMTRSRAVENNAPNELMAEYYGQRAGAALIVTEGTSPSANGIGYPRIPGIYNQEQIEGWKLVTKAVHDKGGKIFLQLMHVGRVGHVANLPQGSELVAPTTKVAAGEMYTDAKGPQAHSQPRLMTMDDIKDAIAEYVQAAKNAIRAGFDGVEIHAANGYLIEQFINKEINELDNEYGGSLENCTRFALDIAREITEAIGKNRTGIRISPYGVFNDMPDYDSIDDTYIHLIKELNKIGVAYVHLLDHSGIGAPEVPQAIKTAIRDEFNSTLILCGNYNKVSAEKDLSEDKADLIAFGRPYVSNPDLVNRYKVDEKLIDPDPGTFYTSGREGYVDYPFLENSIV